MRPRLAFLSAAIALALAGGYVVTFPWWKHPVPQERSSRWRYPASVPAGAAGEAIRRGELIFTHTAEVVGPETAARVSGNHLACAHCHRDGGRAADAIGLVGVVRRFPQFNARSGRVIRLEDRINGCFERSLNGRRLSGGSSEMRALVAYLEWLSSLVPPGTKRIEGQGVAQLPALSRFADPVGGEQVYRRKCVRCHGPDGHGQKDQSGTYLYPPLWGPDSYNDGAGMDRVRTAAGFVLRNMPRDRPDLTVEDAFDVAAYIASRPRPHREGLDFDYPERRLKPFDCPYPPWADGFDPGRHKYGPFPAN